jgi:hypothetical protein
MSRTERNIQGLKLFAAVSEEKGPPRGTIMIGYFKPSIVADLAQGLERGKRLLSLRRTEAQLQCVLEWIAKL